MKTRAILLAAAAFLAVPASASAIEYEVTRNVGVASDYVWRGVSQSDGEMSFSLGADLTSGIFYAGTWAGQVDFNTDATFEWDFYAGIKPSVGPVTFDFGVLAYIYPEETALNIIEGKAAASFEVNDAFSLTGSLFYSPEVTRDGPSSAYAELAAGYDIPANIGPFDLSGILSVGSYTFDEDTFADYTNFRIGISGATENGWTLAANYTDTDQDGPEIYEGRFAVSLLKAF